MSKEADWLDHLGEPDIKLAGLQIWVHGRQFPDSDDYWDGNWLYVTRPGGRLGRERLGYGADHSSI